MRLYYIHQHITILLRFQNQQNKLTRYITYMINHHLANLFFDIAAYLEMDDIPFKPVAYRKAAFLIDSMTTDIKEIYEKGGRKALLGIPGIGENLADKIEEYIRSGTIKAHDVYSRRIPVDLKSLMKIEGLGPKRIKELYQKLGVKNIHDLQTALENHTIKNLFGFGEKTESNIKEGLAFFKLNTDRFPLRKVLPTVQHIMKELKKLKEVKKISVAGSVRRKKPDIGDVDILVVSDEPKKVTDVFINLPQVIKVWGVGDTKASVVLRDGFDVDLRIVPEESYGAAMQYFTGSKEHNIRLRKIAQEKGLKLNEYGLFKGPKMIAGKTEEDIYRALGQPFLPPEKR